MDRFDYGIVREPKKAEVVDSMAILEQLSSDFAFFAPRCLKIKAKDGRMVPFDFNTAQRFIHAKLEEQKERDGYVRAIILKGRQQGCSTYIEGRYYHQTSMTPGRGAYILTHEDNATRNLFSMAKRYWENAPPVVRPRKKASNANILLFDQIESGYAVGTAKTKDTGRSLTFQLFHGSEVAFWPNAEEHMSGVGQALPLAEGTECILESTAESIGNYYHETWCGAELGDNDYIPIFVPWFWQDEYRMRVKDDFRADPAEMELHELYGLTAEQLAWRRYKIRNDFKGDLTLFQREYPCTPSEAFLHGVEGGFITPLEVQLARAPKVLEPVGAKILTCDPAEYGEDETVIGLRHGPFVHPFETMRKLGPMEVAGRIARRIDRDKPDATFIDMTGIGSGIVSRLHELGYYQVIGVHFGGSPDDAELYVRKADEMWDRMREFIRQESVLLPDDNVLESQLTSRLYTHDSSRRLRLEPKEQMKKRGVRSPDRADALALSFAYAVSPIQADSTGEGRERVRGLTRGRRARWSEA